MKTLSVTTPIKWKIIHSKDGRFDVTLVCDRLGITTEGRTLTDAIQSAKEAMELLFQDIYNEGHIFKYGLDHGLAFTFTDITAKEVDIITPVIVVEDKPTGATK